jgi:lipopolysaccharide export system permease protein
MLKHDGGIDTRAAGDVRVFTLTPDGQLTRFEWAKTAEQRQAVDAAQRAQQHAGRRPACTPPRRSASVGFTRLNPQVLAQSLIQPQYLSMRDLRATSDYLEANGENARRLRDRRSGVACCIRSTCWCWCCARCRSRSARCVRVAWASACSSACCWRSAGTSCRRRWSVSARSTVCPPLLANLLPALILIAVAWFYFRRDEALLRLARRTKREGLFG